MLNNNGDISKSGPCLVHSVGIYSETKYVHLVVITVTIDAVPFIAGTNYDY